METDQNKVSKTTSNSCKRTAPKSFRLNDDKPQLKLQLKTANSKSTTENEPTYLFLLVA